MLLMNPAMEVVSKAEMKEKIRSYLTDQIKFQSQNTLAFLVQNGNFIAEMRVGIQYFPQFDFSSWMGNALFQACFLAGNSFRLTKLHR